MPISPYYKPAQSEYTSQFVEQQQPYDLMLKAGQQRQSQIDEVRNLAAETKGKLNIDADPRLSGSYAVAKEREQAYADALEEDLQEFYETGNVRRAARKLTSLSNQWQNDFIKQQVESQSKRFRDHVKEYRKMVQNDKKPISKWMRNGEWVSGITSEGFYDPVVGLRPGTDNEEIRKMFEEKMDVKSQTMEINGEKRTVRPKEKMYKHIGLTEDGRLTKEGVPTYNQWVSDIGRDRLIDYMSRTGWISSDMSPEKIDKQAQKFYERTAREVADRYYQNDLRGSIEGDDDKYADAFGTDDFYPVDYGFNYDNQRFNEIINIESLKDVEAGKRDPVQGEIMTKGASVLARTQLGFNPFAGKLAEIQKEIDKKNERSDEVQLIMDVQGALTEQGILDPDVQDNKHLFRENPQKNNYFTLKYLLDRRARGDELNATEKQLVANLLGTETGIGNLQTIGEIEESLTEEKASNILQNIRSTETQFYGKVLEQSKPKRIENPSMLRLSGDEQRELRNLSIGQVPVIDADRGVQMTGDFIDRNDFEPRGIVQLPLVKETSESGKERWVHIDESKQEIDPSQYRNQWFIEASGKIDQTNLEPEQRQQLLALQQKGRVQANTPIDTQFEKDKKEILGVNKLMIPINNAIAKQIVISTDGNRLDKKLLEYTSSGEQEAIGPTSNPSENL